MSMPTRPRRRRKTQPVEAVTQMELQQLADIDAYLNVLRWYRKRAGFKLARRIEHGAPVEGGMRRAILKGGQLEVR